MGKPKKIDLNKYIPVKTIEELDGYTGLIITPLKLKDGTTPPDIYFRGREVKELLVDTESADWDKSVCIEKNGTKEEYAVRVDWWFDNARTNEEYRDNINTHFNKHGFDVVASWNKAIIWLKGRVPSARKTDLDKFIWNWLNKGLQMQIGRSRR